MAYRSRILDPGASWEVSPDVQDDVAKLRQLDQFAYANLVGLQRDATDSGMRAAFWLESGLDYRAPINQAPDRVVDPPWLGELKTRGKARKRMAGLEWRMYFSEPVERTGLVVICGVGSKDPSQTRDQGAHRQEVAIRHAMLVFQRFCRAEGLTYPPFEPM